MEMVLRKISRIQPDKLTGLTRNFAHHVLALNDPTRGMQIRIGERRIATKKDGAVIRPLFVPLEEGRAKLKGDADQVVALGNGGYSVDAEPQEWFAGSVVGKVNGKMPFLFSSENVDAKGQLVYATPTLIIGRGNDKIKFYELEINGPASLEKISSALRSNPELSKKTYSVLELEGVENAQAQASYVYTFTYSYTTAYSNKDCEDEIHAQSVEVSGKPISVLLSANGQDTHGILSDNNLNVHLNALQIPEHIKAKGLVFSLQT